MKIGMMTWALCLMGASLNVQGDEPFDGRWFDAEASWSLLNAHADVEPRIGSFDKPDEGPLAQGDAPPLPAAIGGQGHHHHAGHSTHVPIGVMGAHAHEKGEWMFSYRYMQMHMDGLRSGDRRIGNDQVLTSGTGSFMVTPTDMDMEMHMIGAMNAINDQTTVMVMLPYIRKRMNHLTAAAANFNTRAEGFGDLKISALQTIDQGVHHQTYLNFGISAPTGSINKIDFTPAGTVRLPYPMQLGSGTWDLMPGFTHTEHLAGPWSGGFQVNGVIRLGRNGFDYSLGNEANLTHWWMYDLNDTSSCSLRFNHKVWGNIDGADAAQGGPPTVPTKRTDMRGGYRSDVMVGLSTYDGSHRFAAEFGVPLYQNLEGIQLEIDWMFIVGWQYTW